jgi:hypothetical protein
MLDFKTDLTSSAIACFAAGAFFTAGLAAAFLGAAAFFVAAAFLGAGFISSSGSSWDSDSCQHQHLTRRSIKGYNLTEADSGSSTSFFAGRPFLLATGLAAAFFGAALLAFTAGFSSVLVFLAFGCSAVSSASESSAFLFAVFLGAGADFSTGLGAAALAAAAFVAFFSGASGEVVFAAVFLVTFEVAVFAAAFLGGILTASSNRMFGKYVRSKAGFVSIFRMSLD